LGRAVIRAAPGVVVSSVKAREVSSLELPAASVAVTTKT
jgi:hypothetical protein